MTKQQEELPLGMSFLTMEWITSMEWWSVLHRHFKAKVIQATEKDAVVVDSLL